MHPLTRRGIPLFLVVALVMGATADRSRPPVTPTVAHGRVAHRGEAAASRGAHAITHHAAVAKQPRVARVDLPLAPAGIGVAPGPTTLRHADPVTRALLPDRSSADTHDATGPPEALLT